MGFLAFALIGGPWVALVAFLWLRRNEGDDVRMEVFQGGTSPSAPENPASVADGAARMKA